MIIGLVGFIGSGKDTAADYLVTNHGFRRESFAGTLKDAVSAIFGWDRVLLEGKTTEAREWRDQVDPWWSARLNLPNLTPRLVLQQWGTEVVRQAFHDDMWVASLENKLRKTKDDIVISDVRFPNEIKAIHAAGGLVIRIKRGAEPEWYQAALDYNAGIRRCGWALGKDTLQRLGVHASEYAWIGDDIDLTIENSGSIDDLFANVKNRVLDRSASTEVVTQ